MGNKKGRKPHCSIKLLRKRKGQTVYYSRKVAVNICEDTRSDLPSRNRQPQEQPSLCHEPDSNLNSKDINQRDSASTSVAHETKNVTEDVAEDKEDEEIIQGDSHLVMPQESPCIEGRRIIHIDNFFKKIKEIAGHGPLNCGLESMEIVAERRTGLSSKFTLQCKLCNVKFLIDSDSPEEVDINQSAVAGALAIGCGLWQLQELTAALNLPIITPRVYKQTHEKISEQLKKISIDSMNQAAKRERELAIAEQRVDKDGIPIIDVIVDGCWSKRTYKKNYSALSGAASIIGKKTGEILFLGIRNKYCCICAQAQKKDIEPKTHICFKNYDGPSTGMESDILLEGFRSSIEMHNLIYGRMVSDGDSNTYSKILKHRPYPHITVEKIECRNHVLRNLCNKLVQLQTDTKYPIQFRKQLTQKKIMILRKTIRTILKTYRTDSESERRCNIELVYNDILLSHLHAFNDHSRCKSYFCTDLNKHDQNTEDGNNFFTSTLWNRICLIVSNVASHAPSLVHDVDSNLVERYNSIVAKMVGGKRINFSLRGSYQARCQAALVSFNSHKMISSLFKAAKGQSPRGKIKTLENRRLKQMRITRKTMRKKNRKLFQKGNDENYGEKCEKPDMTEAIFEKEKEIFLNKLNRTKEEREKIQKETVLQSSCGEWMEIRRKILTASNFGRVIKRRDDVSCGNIVKDLLYKESIAHVASVKHGRDSEIKAIQQLIAQEKVDIQPCGLFIDENTPFFGASPDGVIGDDMIVEVKCPVTVYKEGLNDAIKNKKMTFYKRDKNDKLIINKKHNWYYQIQGQLHVTKKSKCLFGIWCGENSPMKTEIISKDDLFWENEMKEKLQKFYLNCILPELVDPRHSRSMVIRDPDYITRAIEEKRKKKEENEKKKEEKENLDQNRTENNDSIKTRKCRRKTKTHLNNLNEGLNMSAENKETLEEKKKSKRNLDKTSGMDDQKISVLSKRRKIN